MRNSFAELTLDELVQKKEELGKKLNDIRFQTVMGHVENPVERRIVRRSIARINTLLKEHELGIRKA